MGIVTDILIVFAAENNKNRVWDVSGRHASIVELRGDDQEAGESGGNVRIKCNEIIGAERWTIAYNGGNGGSARKWSVEEFKEVFSPIWPLVEEAKKEKADEQISDQSTIKDLYERLEDESKKSKSRHTVILCKGAKVGQGGYGGDIILELSNKEHGLPPAGMEMYQAMDIGGASFFHR